MEGSDYPGFRQEVRVLKKGSVNGENAKPLDCDIVFERDVPVKLRDGVTIYTDIFRPDTQEKIPAIIAWTPYGKHFHIHDFPGGIPRETVSNLQKQECPDPGFWCAHGYAVVQPDTRGAWNSEGDTVQWGEEEGKDAYDLIEWAAGQEWCSGKIGTNGDSMGARSASGGRLREILRTSRRSPRGKGLRTCTAKCCAAEEYRIWGSKNYVPA